MKTNVVIIEDDQGVRECLQALLNRSTDCRCDMSFRSGEEALEKLDNASFDVALVDIGLPGINGIEVIKRLKEMHGDIKIVMLTVYEEDDKIFSALKAGADGYLLKRSKSQEILKAIKEVANNGAPMTGIIARKVIHHFRDGTTLENACLNALSEREMEILVLLAKGDLYKEIAAQLSISYETVHTHIRRIYEKLHVRSRTQAVTKYLSGR